MNVIGADGCNAGWFFVGLGADGPRHGIVKRAADLLDLRPSADLILIDVPIGLRDSGSDERRCDQAARRLLGARRGSSVFRAPSRPALSGASYSEASEINFQVSGKRLSQQSWQIAAKIAEVDLLMRTRPDARCRIREVHPEVLFWSLAGGQPMAERKARVKGRKERREILELTHPSIAPLLQSLGSRPPQGAEWDDVLDAVACAVTGLSPSLATLPPNPELDAFGLPMEMVYATDRLTRSDYA